MVMNYDPETRLAMTPRWLTVAEYAADLGISEATVYNLVAERKITHIRLPGGPKKPGLIRIPRDATEEFRCEANPSSSTSKAEESSTSSGPRRAVAELRSSARLSRVVPMPRRRGPGNG